MKKVPLIIIVLTFMFSNIHGQNSGGDLRNTLQVGLKIGTNYSNVYNTKGDGFNADPKFGIVTGFFLMLPIGKILGFQPEIQFSQKGFKSSGTFLTIPYRYKRTSSFIDLPLLISLKPIKQITILFGPQYSYLVVEKNQFLSGNLSVDQKNEFDNSNIRKNTLCLLGGVDINVNHLIFGLRAGWDITNNNGDGTSTIPEYKNVWYQFSIGIKSYK